MAISKSSQCYQDTESNLKFVLEGLMISVDPSIGSTSSMPGYAVYRAGQLVESGIMSIPAHETRPERLRRLSNHMRKLFNDYPPDVLLYEEIPPQRQGGGNATAHASLLMALGVMLSVPGPSGHIGIYPVSWKKLVRDTYVKGDKEDAEEMGHIVIQLARRIYEERAASGKNTKKQRKGK